MFRNGYAHPEVLVETEWVANNLSRPNTRFVEIDVDTTSYDKGHIPGAIGWNWRKDTQDQVVRDIPSPEHFEALLERSGISNHTTIVLYGDNNNWFAAYAFWLLKYYGHEDVRLMNGGRQKWVNENRPLTTDVPQVTPGQYEILDTRDELRALRSFVEMSVGHAGRALIDVRSPGEYSGELLAPAHIPQEGSQRGGHIPGAQNIGWAEAVAEDGTYKSAEELSALYRDKGITGDKEIITYCRIGERSAHTWFALKYLLGYTNVSNYDGSWTEWGSLIGVPIEKTFAG